MDFDLFLINLSGQIICLERKLVHKLQAGKVNIISYHLNNQLVLRIIFYWPQLFHLLTHSALTLNEYNTVTPSQ